MRINRYARAIRLKSNGRGSSNACAAIYYAVKNEKIRYERRTIKQGERLDIIAGQVYGNSSYWWVIAAASGIGWGLQVPGGTVINIPSNLEDINLLVG